MTTVKETTVNSTNELCDVTEDVVSLLIEVMQNGAIETSLRHQAGLLLGRMDWRPEDLDTFIKVSPGKFLYGDKQERRQITHCYWIATYPVTNAQYRRFVDKGGYECEAFWSKEGWSWLAYWYQLGGADRPTHWADTSFSDYSNALVPVVGVTHYEAEAYCRWLTQQMREQEQPALTRFGLCSQDMVDRGLRVRLPTGEEWEYAARGPDGREYPWGNQFAGNNANTFRENEIGRPTAVCTYPQGIAPTGAWDMSGNVWEWTQEGRLRGGSWFSDDKQARCASVSDSMRRSHENFHTGFRAAVALVS